jgi:hypothetical protein
MGGRAPSGAPGPPSGASRRPRMIAANKSPMPTMSTKVATSPTISAVVQSELLGAHAGGAGSPNPAITLTTKPIRMRVAAQTTSRERSAIGNIEARGW